MGRIDFGHKNGLYFQWNPPTQKDVPSFVFFNALTGDHEAWEAHISPECRKAGCGTLCFNYRGQTNSPFSDGTRLDDTLIVSDTLRLLKEIQPPRAILVGLSIGGLFAAGVVLEGFQAAGLVLINTLRRDGPRLKWIGDALVRMAQVGGLELLRDLYLPLLMNEDWLEANRNSFLAGEGYAGLNPKSGAYKLLSEAGRLSEWAIPWETLDLPTWVITGLQDHVFYNESDVAALSARISQVKRIDMPRTGHLIPAERPAELADMLMGFAQEV
ncbi:MAG: alpha/beta hydrolase [Deltaproteobacteria bacterium]|jgi:3-oxoadipate enol-lactonase|nr:alpha/beta hydrolase [Deltaproteobacteria bacterium]